MLCVEVRLDPIRAPLNGSENRCGGGDEVVAGLGARFVFDRLLQIFVEIFIRIVFRRLSRKIENLDLVFVASKPLLNCLGMMDA